METDIRALLVIAHNYFDAAYEMDADKFASLFDRSSSVTKVGDDGHVSVTPIEKWLAVVRSLRAPKQLGLERHDEILSIDVVRELAILKLKLQMSPRSLTDMLLCPKNERNLEDCSESDDHGNDLNGVLMAMRIGNSLTTDRLIP